jgi:hypothetical protein
MVPFLVVQRALSPIIMYYAPCPFSLVLMSSGLIFMFCAPEPIFSGTEGVGSILHVLWTSGRVCLICATEPVFDGTEDVGSSFHVLRSRTHFRRYRKCQFQFSYFAPPDERSEVSRSSGPVFMYCAPGPMFGDSERISSSFHLLCSRTHFRRY